jgi:hypothetical protein
MLTARYRQRATERLRYVINLSHWMDEGVTIQTITPLNLDGLIVTEVAPLPPDQRSYQYFVTGGEPGAICRLTFYATLSDGQVRADVIDFIIDGSA